MAKRKYRIFTLRRTIIYLICLAITGYCAYINLPIFYERDEIESYAFFSDTNSAYNLKYDKCSLESIDDATSSTVDFYFGCYSDQLKIIPENPPNSIIMFYGNCGHTVQYNSELLTNDMPDYLIEFPFDIDGIGRACRKRIYIVDGNVEKSEDIELKTWNASYFEGRDNTLIVEWGDPPTINEFRFNGKSIFKQISYDKKSVNWDMSDEWKRQVNLDNNAPSSFVIELKIPKRFSIENVEQYEISHETQGIEEFKDYVIVKTDLVQSKIFHLVLIDSTKHWLMTIFNWIWVFFVAVIMGDLLLLFTRDRAPTRKPNRPRKQR